MFPKILLSCSATFFLASCIGQNTVPTPRETPLAQEEVAIQKENPPSPEVKKTPSTPKPVTPRPTPPEKITEKPTTPNTDDSMVEFDQMIDEIIGN